MQTDHLESAARDNLARVIESDVVPEELDLGSDMADGYGLTSMNKIVFLMSLCEDTGVELSVFTETDVAAMHTLHDVIEALGRHVEAVA
jgi:acyl carrier protein